MFKNNILKRIFKVELIIVLISIFSFGIVCIWNSSFLYGFLVGAFASTYGFMINIFTAKLLLRKRRSKKKTITLIALRIFVQMTWYVLWIFDVIWMDSSLNGFSFGAGGIHSLLSPVNFFTFIFGISIVYIVIFFTYILEMLINNKRKEI